MAGPGDPAFYRSRSFWLDNLVGDDLSARPALPGDAEFDVVIVGAGFTGLWTAYYLTEVEPGLRIAVLDADIAGFGASGRNGGWCSAFLPMGLERVARTHGAPAARALYGAMVASVAEVGRVAEAEHVDCHFDHDGSLWLATEPPHVERLQRHVADQHRLGLGDDDVRWLGPSEARDEVAVDGVRGAVFTPHCAALHPALLVRGLADVVEERGVPIYERTPVVEIGPGVVRTEYGRVRAEVVVRATEGFTPTLAGHRRALAPIYSLMVVTDRLPEDFWDAVGWRRRTTLTDGRHLLVYAQRTRDGRIAFGGRGAPYHLGSAVKPAFDRDDDVFAALRASLAEWFPTLADVPVTHAWGGPLGVARDWWASVGFDREAGVAWAGGYVGDGVAASNLAGRTLAHLLTGTESELTRLAWVDHRSRRWEPEPVRWLGINAALRLPRAADRKEARTGRPSRARTWLLGRLLGH